MIHAEITEHEYVMNDSSHDLKTRRPAIDATLQGDKVIEENKGWGDGTGGTGDDRCVFTHLRGVRHAAHVGTRFSKPAAQFRRK